MKRRKRNPCWLTCRLEGLKQRPKKQQKRLQSVKSTALNRLTALPKLPAVPSLPNQIDTWRTENLLMAKHQKSQQKQCCRMTLQKVRFTNRCSAHTSLRSINLKATGSLLTHGIIDAKVMSEIRLLVKIRKSLCHGINTGSKITINFSTTALVLFYA